MIGESRFPKLQAISLALILSVLISEPALAQQPHMDPASVRVSAPAAILIDRSDGKVLWEKNPNQKRAIASTTKIVTALVVLEHTKAGERVTASAAAEAVGNSDSLITELELTNGEVLTVRQLLYGLLLVSASDAAVALAEHVGRSINGFAKLMNDWAAKAGARNSQFVNPDGLDDPAHYSTASDMALIARRAMNNELFSRIVATQTYSIPRADPTKPVVLKNRNQLLGTFEGANGIKTGQTLASGKSLVASAQRGNEGRISVVLGSVDSFADSRALLNLGFDGFQRVSITNRGKPWGQIAYGNGAVANLIPAKSFGVLVQTGRSAPSVSFNSRSNVLKVDDHEGGVTSIRVSLKCGAGECGEPDGDRGGLLAQMMSLAKPALSLFQ